MHFSPHLIELKARCGTTIVLPYALTIVDCHFLYNALASLGRGPFQTDVDGRVDSRNMGSAFDLYAFDREIDEVEATLMHDAGHAFLYWDARERFVAVGGHAEFCALAAPYPTDVRKHYFLEGMSPPLSESEADELYALLSKG